MDQYCFARCRLSASVVSRHCLSASSVVVCNAAGRLSREPTVAAGPAAVRVSGPAAQHCTAGQYIYAPLGRHLVISKVRYTYNVKCVIIFV